MWSDKGTGKRRGPGKYVESGRTTSGKTRVECNKKVTRQAIVRAQAKKEKAKKEGLDKATLIDDEQMENIYRLHNHPG